MFRPSALLAAALAIAASDEAPPQGMDVLPLVRAAGKAIAGPPPPVPGRPWSDDLAALTDPDPSANGPAVGRLVRRGAEVLADLGLIATDRDWQVRTRVVRVAAGIGGEAGAPLVLRLASDADPRVRRMAIVGLGRCRGEPVRTRLEELIGSRDPDERAEAAQALAALGDCRSIPRLLALHADPDAPARNAAATALRELVRLPAATATVCASLGSAQGEPRRTLLTALDGAVDTRLCPALSALVPERDALTCLLAVKALSTAGDLRAVEALVGLATSDRLPELREAAATTLRALTGYRAGPGHAWSLWWQDNRAAISRLAARDAMLAELSDPAGSIPPALSTVSAEELWPLVDMAVQAGRPAPPWVAGKALAALRLQADGRWAPLLRDRIDRETDGELRLDLLVLLDEIGGAEAANAFKFLHDRLAEREQDAIKAWKAHGAPPPDLSAERTLIDAGIARKR